MRRDGDPSRQLAEAWPPWTPPSPPGERRPLHCTRRAGAYRQILADFDRRIGEAAEDAEVVTLKMNRKLLANYATSRSASIRSRCFCTWTNNDSSAIGYAIYCKYEYIVSQSKNSYRNSLVSPCVYSFRVHNWIYERPRFHQSPGTAFATRSATPCCAESPEGDYSGRIDAGHTLVTNRLAVRLGVSATPIREALVELEQSGIVELLHHRGAWSNLRPQGSARFLRRSQIVGVRGRPLGVRPCRP